MPLCQPSQRLEAAATVDADIAAGKYRGPLHGIPIGIKDIIDTKGVLTEAGSKVLAGNVPNRDATVTRKLAEAGAIMIGKTIPHEFAYGVNEPPTRTPWALDSYPGGSSTGSGVAVTARSAFGAIGTDTGGSIRIPASINNIVGLKPTYGRVSAHGVIPLSWTLDHVGTDDAHRAGQRADAERHRRARSARSHIRPPARPRFHTRHRRRRPWIAHRHRPRLCLVPRRHRRCARRD